MTTSSVQAARYPLNSWTSTGNPFWSCAVSCYHTGSDAKGTAGTAVYAPFAGVVKEAQSHGGYGGTIIIEGRLNGETVCCLLGHMRLSSLAVAAGNSVSEGRYLGVLGTKVENGGWPEHSHFGIRRGGYVTGNDCNGGWVFQGYASSCVKPHWHDPTLFVLFANAHARNGGEALVGRPNPASHSGLIYDSGPYKRQDFSGGSFGNCCIMYDPNNAVGNPLATNEAYLLRTGFYNYYQSNGNYSAFGCPSRDEYITGDGTNSIQFFVRRVGSETQQHYLYFDPTPPPGEGTVTWHSTYTIAYSSQIPSGQFDMVQGSSRSVTVRFQNTGQFTWHNDPNTYPYDYVQLKSCDANGVVTTSFLNDGSLGWIDTQTPCTMVESAVVPGQGQTATFTFTGKVASNAPLGLKGVYFRPYHSVGGLMDNWGGMYFPVNVVAPPPPTAPVLVTGPGQMVMRDHLTFAFQIGSTVWFTTHYPVDGRNYSQTDTRVKVYCNGNQISGYKENTFLYITGGYDASFAYEADYPRSAEPITYSYTFNGVPTFSAANAVLGGIWGDSHTGVALFMNGSPITGYKEVGSNQLVTPGTPYDPAAAYTAFYPMNNDQSIATFVSMGPGQMVYQEQLAWAETQGSTVWFTTRYNVYGRDYSQTDPRVVVYRNGHQISGFKEGSRIYIGEGYNSSWCYTIDYPRTRTTLTPSYLLNGWRNLVAPSQVWGATWGNTHTALKVFKDGTQVLAYKEVGTTAIVILETSYDPTASYSAEYVEVWNTGNSLSAHPSPPDDPPPMTTAPRSFRVWTAPNPVVSNATINFTLPVGDRVSISVYDVSGREVARIPQQTFEAGQHSYTWDRTDQHGQRALKGIYFVRFTSHLHTATMKIVIVK